jgi:hypothetical protein
MSCKYCINFLCKPSLFQKTELLLRDHISPTSPSPLPPDRFKEVDQAQAPRHPSPGPALLRGLGHRVPHKGLGVEGMDAGEHVLTDPDMLRVLVIDDVFKFMRVLGQIVEFNRANGRLQLHVHLVPLCA